MADYSVRTTVVKDDGANRFFWRSGELYLREEGREMLVATIAPHLTASLMIEIELYPQRKPAMEEARAKSLMPNQI